MKKWLLFLVHALEAAIVLAAVYFEPSYAIRGRLHGEAMYQGQPTSYWRAKIDRWIQTHGNVELALANTAILVPLVNGDPNMGEFNEILLFSGGPVPPRPFWERSIDLVRNRPEIEVILRPEILERPVGGEEVLRELTKEERYRRIAERALANADVLRAAKEAKR